MIEPVKNSISLALTLLFFALLCACVHNPAGSGGAQASVSQPVINEGLSRAKQNQIAPAEAINLLIEGNNRFLTSAMHKRDLLAQEQSRGVSGQFPFASVISCADSRSDPVLIFDQGIADLFITRVEGNIINPDILGSLEYAAKMAGSKAIVVLGHTHCGAVKGACDGVKLGNFTQLISKISPAIKATPNIGGPDRSSKNYEFVDAAAEKNVENSLKALRANSPILKDMESRGLIKIVGAMLDIETGKVTFVGEAVAPAVKTTIKAGRDK
ncbi:MAG TPA: carbonic anhydrase family protein [Cellvibrionaceae bacterium]